MDEKQLQRLVLELTDAVRVLSNIVTDELKLKDKKDGKVIKKAIDKVDSVRLGR